MVSGSLSSSRSAHIERDKCDQSWDICDRACLPQGTHLTSTVIDHSVTVHVPGNCDRTMHVNCVWCAGELQYNLISMS